VERSGQAIHVGAIMGQLATGGARRFRRRAAALIGSHEPDESRGSSPEFCEGLGVKFPGPTRQSVSEQPKETVGVLRKNSARNKWGLVITCEARRILLLRDHCPPETH